MTSGPADLTSARAITTNSLYTPSASTTNKTSSYPLNAKSVRAWSQQTVGYVQAVVYLLLSPQGSPFTAVEPDYKINQTCVVPNTGLVFLAVEHTKIQSYYIPVSYTNTLLYYHTLGLGPSPTLVLIPGQPHRGAGRDP